MLLMCRLFAEDRVMPVSMTGTRRRRRHMDLRERIRELPFFFFFFFFLFPDTSPVVEIMALPGLRTVHTPETWSIL